MLTNINRRSSLPPLSRRDLLLRLGGGFGAVALSTVLADAGLLVAEKKTVRGINAEFVQTTDPSCLNRWLTEVPWEEQELHRQRLAWLQREPSPRYASSGILPIDTTLVDHAGKLIEDVGYFWEHAEQRHKIAHDYLIVNYVGPWGKHEALDFRRFRKREDCAASRTELGRPAGRVSGSNC